VVGYGAEPRECVEFVRERNWPTLLGNHEAAAVTTPEVAERFNSNAKFGIYYTRGALTKVDRTWIKSLPLSLEEDGIQFVHGSPVPGQIYSMYVLSADEASQAFAAATRPLVFCAHTHLSMVVFEGQTVTHGKGIIQNIKPELKTIIGVGSVGQPRDKDNRACWVLYDTVKGEAEFRRVVYDYQEAAHNILDAGLPPSLAERLKTGV